jgi:hypothetical protein
MFKDSQTSTGRGLHYLKFRRLQPEVRCNISSFTGLNRKSVTLFEASQASTGSALHYLKLHRLQPEVRCII